MEFNQLVSMQRFVQNGVRAQPKHAHVFKAKNKAAGNVVAHVEFGRLKITVHDFNHEAVPASTSLAFSAKKFEGRDGPDGFNEITLFLTGQDQSVGSGMLKTGETGPANQAIKQSGQNHNC